MAFPRSPCEKSRNPSCRWNHHLTPSINSAPGLVKRNKYKLPDTLSFIRGCGARSSTGYHGIAKLFPVVYKFLSDSTFHKIFFQQYWCHNWILPRCFIRLHVPTSTFRSQLLHRWFHSSACKDVKMVNKIKCASYLQVRYRFWEKCIQSRWGLVLIV